MATRSTAVKDAQKPVAQAAPVEPPEPGIDLDLDLPDEFDDEGAPQVSNGLHGAHNGSSANIGLSLDELNDSSFDDTRDEHERAKLDPPAGDWQKSDRWKVEVSLYSADTLPGDIRPAGRTVYAVQGKPDTITVGSIDYTPTLFFRISPDIRSKPDKPEERDNQYKLFLKAKDAYLSLKGEKCPSEKALVHFLQDDDYLVRTMKGDTGPVVVDIKGKKFDRRR